MSESVENNEILTAEEAADLLRVGRVTLWRETKKGRIPAFRVRSKVLYRRSDIDAYLDQNKIVPEAETAE